MTTRRPGSLDAVLAVRRKQEETEEHVLSSLAQELREARMRCEQIAEQAAAARSLRLEQVQYRADGADHHHWDACMKQLRQNQSETSAEIGRLEHAYAEQVQRYLEAQRAHEVINNLEQKYALRWRARLQRREQKLYDDLFLMRFVRD